MLEEPDVRDTLAAALGTGGEWAEIYAERRDSTSVSIADRRVEQLTTGRDIGAGVRVVRGASSAYAFTNILTREALLGAARAAAAGMSGDAGATVADLTASAACVVHPVKVVPGDVGKADRVELARRAERAAWACGDEVRQVMASYVDTHRQVFIANSLGHLSDTSYTRTRLVAQVVAARDGLVQTGFEGPGASAGLELYETEKPETTGEKAARQALRLLDSDPAPAGEMTVVLNAGGAGVLFHEACGHGLEADMIVKDTTVYARTRGRKVGSDIFSGVDDATIEGAWGSTGFDDEGSPAQRTVLFDAGVQTGQMTDRISAGQLGTVASGNGRRHNYQHVPLPRMTNSLVLPGESDPAAIVADVGRGLYAEALGGGEVNPATGDFVFGVTEAYLIEHGEITRRVRGATLIGNGPRTLALVDAVGTDFAMKQGMCGKGGQWVPVAFGTPTLRIARLTVGGTGG